MTDVTQKQARTLVLGVGNTLLSDEGAGVHAVRFLQERFGDAAEAEFIDAGTLSFALAGLIEEADSLIVIDAAQLDARPGTVSVFVGDAMDRFLQSNRKLSVHEVSLLDLLAVARLADRLPARRALIGIQPQTFEWGERPSEPVARAIPGVGELAMSLIGRWRE
jgi:hydrogenase maturation protease